MDAWLRKTIVAGLLLAGGVCRAAAPDDLLRLEPGGLPLVISYTVVVYWIFRGKVKLGENSY